MIKVNLVPKELLDREVQKQRVLQASVVAGLFAMVVMGVSVLHIYRANSLESDLAEMQKEYDKLAKVVAQVEELERTANAVKQRLNVIVGLLKGRPLYPYFMTDFLSSMPAGVWITNLTTTAKEGVGLGVTTAATSATSEGVSQWLRNLDGAPAKYGEVKLSGAISISDKDGTKEHKFTLALTYKAGL